MKRNLLGFRILFWGAVLLILLPLIVLAVWSIAQSWRFPHLLPQSFSTRGLREILDFRILPVLASSILISCCAALCSTVVGTLTARAVAFYDFPLKHWVQFFNLLPLMIPATAFAMGIHIVLIRLGLSDTIAGVILVHLVCSLPYSVNIMTDVTNLSGRGLEEQALLLGATPARAFREISFFALLPGLVTSFCIAYIISFSQYFLTLMIGGGNVQTLSTLMIPYIQSGDRTVSGAYSMVFILSTLLVLAVAEWMGKRLGRRQFL